MAGRTDGRAGGRAGGRADGRTHGRVGGRNGRAGLENLIILPLVAKAQFFQTTSKAKHTTENYNKKTSANIPRMLSQRKHQKMNKKHAVEMQATQVFERK